MNASKAEYSLGTVQAISTETELSSQEGMFVQELEILTDDGSVVLVSLGSEYQPVTAAQKKSAGDRVILVTQQNQDGLATTAIADAFRLPTVAWLFFVFVFVVVAVSRFKGFLSILGMLLSFIIITAFVIPYILLGYNPVVISLIGALGIGVVTIYLSHGFNIRSHIALASILASLLFVAILAALAVQGASLFGLGSEEAYFLQFSSKIAIDLRGLLLGGIMLGALGVLDDVAVSQVSVVAQLRAVKKDISFIELYTRSLEVGKDHVASLVNTLVLAYAGANLPLWFLFALNEDAPYWVVLNGELIVEEVIRTLAGSIGLVLAVPLTTVLAAALLLKLDHAELKKIAQHAHHHH